MGDPWEILRASGVPAGAPRRRPASALDGPGLRTALGRVLAPGDGLPEREATPLCAWLRGFRQHWPAQFAALLGATGEAALAHLGAPADPNRYLKLRRIAIDNLAGAL